MKKLIPHIVVILMFACLFALGTWQVQRRFAKQDMLARIDANVNAAPITPETFKNISQDEFKKMNLTGKYIHDKDLLLLNRSHNGKPGQHVMTPFLTSGGETILVDRGWIPTDREYEKPEGEMQITGVVRATQKLNFMANMITLANDPPKQNWFWLDLPALYQSVGVPPKDYYLDLIDPERTTKSYPYALDGKIEVYNEHMVYIITWYSLSIVLLLVYYFRFWRK